MNPIYVAYRVLRKIVWTTRGIYNQRKTIFLLNFNRVSFHSDLISNGCPTISVAKQGAMKIGSDFRMNNGPNHNRIGRQQPCIFMVENGGTLTIGDNVAMSATAIVCTQSVTIENGARLGGNTVIYDTDFHSLDPKKRTAKNEDVSLRNSRPVHIESNVFIGGHTTILKGTRIGANSIVGACSVVTRDIPPNEIWGGNPAKLIKKIDA